MEICRMTIRAAVIPAQPVMGMEWVVIQTVNGSNMDAIREPKDTRFEIQTDRMKIRIESIQAVGAMARKHRLLETGGSDFHGSHRPGIGVGAATIDRESYERLLTAGR